MLDMLAYTLLVAAGTVGAKSILTHDQGRVIAAVNTKTNWVASKRGEFSGVLKYKPNAAGNYIIGGLYTLYGVSIFCYLFRRKDRWALCLPIGCICSAFGYFIRPSLDPNNISLGLYIVQSMFVVISPAAFLAFNYLLYGRMILAIDKDFGRGNFDEEVLASQSMTGSEKLTMLHKSGGPKCEKSRYSFVPPRIVGSVFVWSDVVTFLIQCNAGGLQASGGATNPSLTNIGDKMFLAGVILQGISYVLFSLLLTYATVLVIREGTGKRQAPSQASMILGLERPIFALVGGLYFSSIFIIVSCTPDSPWTKTTRVR